MAAEGFVTLPEATPELVHKCVESIYCRQFVALLKISLPAPQLMEQRLLTSHDAFCFSMAAAAAATAAYACKSETKCLGDSRTISHNDFNCQACELLEP